MFRICVNAPCQKVISALNEHFSVQVETIKSYRICGHIAEIYQNEDYVENITDDFLYYQTIADFIDVQSTPQEAEIRFAKSVRELFLNRGWKADIVAEFELLL